MAQLSASSKVAVTGATGHIGNVICRILVERGVSVRALVRKDRNPLEGLDLECVVGDVLDQASLERLCDGCSTVFHLAAKISIKERQARSIRQTNFDGTANVLAACRSTAVGRLIHFSSIHATDPQRDRSTADDSAFRPKMAYDASKTDSETLVREANSPELETLVIVPTAVIGPGDYRPSLLGQAIIKISQRRLPMLLPYGYNFVDVRDVALGAIRAAEIGLAGSRYVLSGRWASFRELSEAIARVTGRKTTTWVGPVWLAYLSLPLIAAYARLRQEEPLYTRNSIKILRLAEKYVSYQQAANDLNYSPRPLEESLADLFRWYQEHGMV